MRDLDALVAIEESGFDTDQLSRRSFRHWLGQRGSQRTSLILVAEADLESGEKTHSARKATARKATARKATAGETTVGTSGGKAAIGYGLLLFRKGTASARLYSLAVLPAARGLGAGRALLDALEAEAFDHDRMTIRLEVSEQNDAAIGLYETAGYRKFGRYEDYYDDGAAALRYEKWLPGDVDLAVDVDISTPYYEQTTEFTCGPSCLLMALRRYNPRESEWWSKAGPQLEVRLWRESTTVFMTSGIGGCEPFGLAVAAAEYGLVPEIYVSSKRSVEQLLFLDSVRREEKRRVMTLAQRDFRDRAGALKIPVQNRGLTAAALARVLRDGRVAIVLLSGYPMFGKKVPHWVLAHAADDRHIIVNDPWVEYEAFESQTDAANVPIPFDAFDWMSRYGRSGLRAAVVLGPATKNERSKRQAR